MTVIKLMAFSFLITNFRSFFKSTFHVSVFDAHYLKPPGPNHRSDFLA